MQKTYKCPNGHKFKTEEAETVKCPSCNEKAEPVKWKAVDEFSSTGKGLGVMDEIGSIAREIKDEVKGKKK